MSTPPKRPRVQSLAGMEELKIDTPEDTATYHTLIVDRMLEVFEADPQLTRHLFAINIIDFPTREHETAMVAKLRNRGYSYQVVRFGGKTGKDTGVLITRLTPLLKPEA